MRSLPAVKMENLGHGVEHIPRSLQGQSPNGPITVELNFLLAPFAVRQFFHRLALHRLDDITHGLHPLL
jgi:hypothetical protein